MLEYLILNRKFEAASKLDQTSAYSFNEQLLLQFSKGNRQQFFRIFNFLKKQSKLEFYLRVYFFIYSIHPEIVNKETGVIPESQKTAFKDYLDNRGAELAKTNQFLEFYALPFIKKPLQHQAFRNLFKKEWIKVLKQKLIIFLHEEEKRLKNETKKIFSESNNIVSHPQNKQSKVLQQKIKQMEAINKELYEEVKQFAEKCHILEDSHKIMAQGFNSHMMQSQSKWFQITKQLVDCSKSLIQMLIASNSQFLGDRKFLKIKKRTEKYEKFVNKKFDDLVSQSQDISIFDKPSLNDLSYSVTPHTQKSNGVIIKDLSTIMGVDEYIPTDFVALKNYFKRCNASEKNSVFDGFLWRIVKSKDKKIRRLNISAIFKEDFLGLKNGQITQFIASHQTMRPIVRLLQLISQDTYGRKLLFINHNLHRDLISLIHNCKDKGSLQSIMSMLSAISSEKKFKEDLIRLDIIEACLTLLRKGEYEQNEMILQNITTILLNTIMLSEGLQKYIKQMDVFQILKKYIRVPSKIVKTLIYGIIFSLLQDQQLFQRAHLHKMSEFFNSIQKIDPSISKKQLYYLKDKISKYQPRQEHHSDDAQQEEQQIDDDSENGDQYPAQDIQNMFKKHEELVDKFSLKPKQAKKQYKEVKQFYQETKNMQYVPKFYEPKVQVSPLQYNSPKNISSYSKQPQTPYIQQSVKTLHQVKQKKINNFISPKVRQKQEQQQIGDRDFRIKQKDENRPNLLSKQNKIKFNQPQKIDEQQNRRLKKSVSADRVGRSQDRDQKIYESHRLQRNRVSQFRNAEQRNYRSPQSKKMPRQQMLKQLNEQLKAGDLKRKIDYHQPDMNRQHKESVHTKNEKLQKKDKQADEIFQPKSKLKRTLPRDEIL